MVVGGLEAGGFVACALDIDLVTTQPTNEMMVRFDVRVVAQRPSHHVGAAYEAGSGEGFERVVNGIERDSGKLMTEVFSHFFGRCVTTNGNKGIEHTKPLLSDPQARGSQPVDDFVACEVCHQRVLQSWQCALSGLPGRRPDLFPAGDTRVSVRFL